MKWVFRTGYRRGDVVLNNFFVSHYVFRWRTAMNG